MDPIIAIIDGQSVEQVVEALLQEKMKLRKALYHGVRAGISATGAYVNVKKAVDNAHDLGKEDSALPRTLLHGLGAYHSGKNAIHHTKAAWLALKGKNTRDNDDDDIAIALKPKKD